MHVIGTVLLTVSPSVSHSLFLQIDFVFNERNIWANVQELTAPCQISFDLSRTTGLGRQCLHVHQHHLSCIDWLPFFSPSFANPGLPSVQTEVLTYTITPADTVLALQARIYPQCCSALSRVRVSFGRVASRTS